MRRLLILAFILGTATRVAAQQPQPERVVTPTYTHEGTCYQTVPCEIPCPPPTTVTALPCTPVPVTPPPVIHYEMRSKALFWTSLGMVAGGGALIVGSMTWAQSSAETSYVTLPCGTDPYFAQRMPIAACEVNRPLLASGISLVGSGVGLMIYASHKVAIGSDGRQVTVRVRF
jgi:hypothetical protein